MKKIIFVMALALSGGAWAQSAQNADVQHTPAIEVVTPYEEIGLECKKNPKGFPKRAGECIVSWLQLGDSAYVDVTKLLGADADGHWILQQTSEKNPNASDPYAVYPYEEEGSFSTSSLKRVDGVYQEWQTPMQIEEQTSYKNNKKHGLSRIWHWESGKLISQENYNDGVKVGLWQRWYENGQLREKGTYQNRPEKIDDDILDDLVSKQEVDKKCSNDNAFDEYLCRDEHNGVKEGLWQSWFENGEIEKSGEYKDGKKNGTWQENYQSHRVAACAVDATKRGAKLTPIVCSAGDDNDKEMDTTYSEGSYVNDLKDGLWVRMNEPEKTKNETQYRAGEWLGSKTWFESGQLESHVQPDGLTGDYRVTTWFENGQMKSDGVYKSKSDQKIGVWRYWDEAGKPYQLKKIARVKK